MICKHSPKKTRETFEHDPMPDIHIALSGIWEANTRTVLILKLPIPDVFYIT